MNLPIVEKAGGASKRGSHRLAQISQCERAWWFSWGRRLEPRDRQRPLVEGSAVHLALAYWWADRMIEPPTWLRETPLEDAMAKEVVGMTDAAPLAYEVRDAYARFYANDAWTPVAVEKEFFATIKELRQNTWGQFIEHPATDNEKVSARIDLLIEVNGKLWAVDHKTTKGGSNGVLARWNPHGEWAISFQFLLQTLILKARFGERFGGVIVQRIKTSKPFDFDRNVVLLPSQVLADGPRTVEKQVEHELALAKQVRENISLGVDMSAWLPPGNFWSCWSWGRPCDFRLLCTAEPEMRSAIVESEFRARGE